VEPNQNLGVIQRALDRFNSEHPGEELTLVKQNDQVTTAGIGNLFRDKKAKSATRVVTVLSKEGGEGTMVSFFEGQTGDMLTSQVLTFKGRTHSRPKFLFQGEGKEVEDELVRLMSESYRRLRTSRKPVTLKTDPQIHTEPG
jgi:hypothetical protein